MPISIAPAAGGRHAAPVSNEWIERILKPQLADVATRDWTATSLGEFMVGLHHQIDAAVADGRLSEVDGIEAHGVVRAANHLIPGVTVVRRTATIPRGTSRAVPRAEPNE